MQDIYLTMQGQGVCASLLVIIDFMEFSAERKNDQVRLDPVIVD